MGWWGQRACIRGEASSTLVCKCEQERTRFMPLLLLNSFSSSAFPFRGFKRQPPTPSVAREILKHLSRSLRDLWGASKQPRTNTNAHA